MWLYFWQLMKEQIGAYEYEFYQPAQPWQAWDWAYCNAFASNQHRAWALACDIAFPDDDDIPF